MSFCSHQLLDRREDDRYQCRDCAIIFDVRRARSEPPPLAQEEPEKPTRVFPIVAILAVIVLLLAALIVFYKLSAGDGGKVAQIPACDFSEYENRAREAENRLGVCLADLDAKKCPICEPRIVRRIVEVPKKCPKVPVKECPDTFREPYQKCMSDLGNLRFGSRQKDKKIAELRKLLSDMTKKQGSCRGATVNVPGHDCTGEINAACGHLRRALDFYWGRRQQPPEGEEPIKTPGVPSWSEDEEFDDDDPDKGFKEPEIEKWDDEDEDLEFYDEDEVNP